MSMLAFLALAAVGFMNQGWDRQIRALGVFCIVVGVVALAGYAIGAPLMYYSTEASSAMAPHTALLFVAAGLAVAFGPSGCSECSS